MKIIDQPARILVLFFILFLIRGIVVSVFRTIRSMRKRKYRSVRTPRPLKAKTGEDCVDCRAGKVSSRPDAPLSMVRPWREVRDRRGRKKGISTQGYACNNRQCGYYHVVEEGIQALVGDGHHGKQEMIQDLKCHACGKKFTVRRDTVMYRLKSHSERVGQALGLMAEGVDISTLERVLGIGEGTMRTWLTRAGEHAERMHNAVFAEVIFRHIQLDELWAKVRRESQEVWLWVALEAQTKVIPVMKLGPRTLDMAMKVVHELKERMPGGCMPIITSDGLKLYYYALTAHFGQWVAKEGERKPVWEIAVGFLYAQVKKIHRRRKLVKVERLMLCGEREKLTERLKGMGMSGRINTAFVERVNLTMD
jgi:transposase-like protein/IS1 family transposase